MAAKYGELADSIDMIMTVIEDEPMLSVRADTIRSYILISNARLTDLIAELVWKMRGQGYQEHEIAERLGISERATRRSYRRYKRKSGKTNPTNVIDRDGYVDLADLMALSGRKARHRQPAGTSPLTGEPEPLWDRRFGE